MTTPDRTTPDRAAPDGAGAAGVSARRLARRLRLPALLGAVVLVTVAVIGAVQSSQAHGVLDPDSPDASGSRALRVLLGQQHVQVERVGTVDAAVAPGDPGTTVLVPFPDAVTRADLAALGRSAFRIVLVEPDDTALAAVTADVTEVGTDPPGQAAAVVARQPGCTAPIARLAGVVDLGGHRYRSTAGTTCYDGSLAVSRTLGGAPLVVFGTAAPLTNARLGQEGNAALALAALGAGDPELPATTVRWWLPPLPATGDGQVGLLDVLPPWVGLAVLQLLLVGAVVVLWRARRLGPVVAEPLPVVVRAAETVEGRARLYRRVQARGPAAAALRGGVLARIVPRLGLDGSPPPSAVVATVAARTGRPEREVAELLYGAVPDTDPELVLLAGALEALEQATIG